MNIKDAGDFLNKLKVVGDILKGTIFVTEDMVGLYPSIPHNGGLEVLRKRYDTFKNKVVPTKDVIKMTIFVLKNEQFSANIIHD